VAADAGTEELWARTIKTLRLFIGEGSISLFLALSVPVLLGLFTPFALLLAVPSALVWLVWPVLSKSLRPKRATEPDQLERSYRQMRSILRIGRVFLAAEAIVVLLLVALRVSGNLPVGDAGPGAGPSGI
jgi:hypothetical protein